MDSEELLAQLADIHLPAPISWWPLAPGWWILLALVSLALAYLVRNFLHARRRKLILSFALAALDDCFSKYDNGTKDSVANLELVNSVNSVLRRVALYHFPRQGVASLSGDAWVDFLNSKAKPNTAMGAELHRSISSGRFQRKLDVDSERLSTFARDWITAQYRSEAPA